jgi:hypothetical protein
MNPMTLSTAASGRCRGWPLVARAAVPRLLVAAGVCLGLTGVTAAQPRIEGQRAVTGRLAEIVDNVRANEELYRNLDYEFRWRYELLRDATPEEHLAKEFDRDVRAVWQDGMQYLHWHHEEPTFVKTYTLGYDGTTTRVLDQTRDQDLVNIHEGLFTNPQLRHPHTLAAWWWVAGVGLLVAAAVLLWWRAGPDWKLFFR